MITKLNETASPNVYRLRNAAMLFLFIAFIIGLFAKATMDTHPEQQSNTLWWTGGAFVLFLILFIIAHVIVKNAPARARRIYNRNSMSLLATWLKHMHNDGDAVLDPHLAGLRLEYDRASRELREEGKLMRTREIIVAVQKRIESSDLAYRTTLQDFVERIDEMTK